MYAGADGGVELGTSFDFGVQFAVHELEAVAFFLENAASSLFFRGVGSGALNTLWAASAPRSNLVNGAYYSPVGYRCGGTAFVQDADVAQRLWDWTEAEISERS